MIKTKLKNIHLAISINTDGLRSTNDYFRNRALRYIWSWWTGLNGCNIKKKHIKQTKNKKRTKKVGLLKNIFKNLTLELVILSSVRFSVDGEIILNIDPVTNFYDFGDFAKIAPNTDNPWKNSPNKMAPFDQEVSRCDPF